jgi:hypothetical protein
VYLSTQDGSATSGMPPDYFVLTYYSVPIPYGSTSTTFHPAAYADSLVEGDETFTVNIVGASNLSVGSPSSHTVTILNDDQYTLKFTQSSVTVGEAAGNANLTVQISQQPTSNVTVDYQSANGSATSGSDYTAVGPTTLTFTPTGPTSQSFNVPITNDTAWESTENFTVSLSNASGANIVSPSTATVNITDNDTPLFSMANSTYSVNEDDGSITVTVNLSIAPPSGQSYSVDYATANVTARAGADYGSASGTITFNAGETSKTRTVSIVDDIFRETDETFTFTLSNPTGVPLPKTLAA